MIRLLLFCGALMAQAPVSSYRVENVPLPRDIAPEVAGVTFGADGKLAATFRRGYLYLLDTKSGRWSRFAGASGC